MICGNCAAEHPWRGNAYCSECYHRLRRQVRELKERELKERQDALAEALRQANADARAALGLCRKLRLSVIVLRRLTNRRPPPGPC